MVKSMTAFGRSKKTTADGSKLVCVELKSVNNRFLDISVRLPRNYAYMEEKIKSYLTSRGIVRGKLDVSLNVDVLSHVEAQIAIDEGLASSYLKALEYLRDRFQLKDDISTMRVAQNKDIFIEKRDEEDIEKEWQSFLPMFEEAVTMFLAAREREGAHLRADLLGKAEDIRKIKDHVADLSKECVDTYAEKLEARIRQILDDHALAIDENRILTEVGIFADRVAIDEELVRLDSHLDAFAQIMDAPEPAGRKLDFLVQEMNREINTIGSKCNHTEMSHEVVEMKTTLEKIREQIQNLE